MSIAMFFVVVNNGTINEVMLIKIYGLIALTLRCSNIYKQIILLKMMCMNRSGKNFKPLLILMWSKLLKIWISNSIPSNYFYKIKYKFKK